MQELADGGVRLTGVGEYPITLDGLDPGAAADLRGVLEIARGLPPTRQLRARVAGILRRSGATWRELEAWTHAMRPVYEAAYRAATDAGLDPGATAWSVLPAKCPGGEVLLRSDVPEDDDRRIDAAANLLAETYLSAVHLVRRTTEARDGRRRFEVCIFEDDDTCAECRARDRMIVEPDQLPVLPFHPGCRCALLEI